MNVKGASHAQGSASVPLLYPPDLRRHILVAEDDALLRHLNTEMLRGSGYEVDDAADGAAAWQALNADIYDLLITDNSMPKVSGVELLEKLRAARLALPVIMATGIPPTEEFTRYPWLQPAAMLLKPYTLEQMLKTVKKVLREADNTAVGSSLSNQEQGQETQ
jgi:DNA-binding response OmpR family regulator